MTYGRCERCPKPASRVYAFTWTGAKGAPYIATYAVCGQACGVDAAKSECQGPFAPAKFPPGAKLRELIGADAIATLTRNSPVARSSNAD